jgi:tetratricopeptide (TPR) repeat protein
MLDRLTHRYPTSLSTVGSVRQSARRLGALTRAGLWVATVLGVVLIWTSFTSQLLAKSPDSVATTSTDDVAPVTFIGNYLSGRFARGLQEPERAAVFYGAALTRDGADEVVLEHAFQMETASGRWDRAVPLAASLVKLQPTHRMARTLLGVSAFKAGDFPKAEEHFKASSEGPIGELTSTIARAWVAEAAGRNQLALDIIDSPKQADWAQYYLYYHRGLIADLSGRFNEARVAFEKVFKQDSRTLRTALAYSHSAANAGDTTLAKSVLKEHLDKQQGDGHPLARELRDRINDGDRPGLLVKNATQGLAEVFYGLGEALTGEGGINLGIVYLQLALFAEPDHPFALAALANTYEGLRKYQSAIDTYERIPSGTALQSSIDIRKAFNLNSLEKVDEAKALLSQVSIKAPSDVRPLEAIGNIMRARKRYEEAITYYTRAIDLVGKPDKRHWAYFYSRGTSYERVKDWPHAEADLQRALALAPDQPMVLNYLGYSWVDQGVNLKQGLALIEKAVSLKPDDGYIVDSLGWALFKLGEFKEAVKYLERAVELRPDDATLNDHLGDGLWRVGRETEARFQWDQALTLKPEPEDVEKIKLKLEKGLPPKGGAAKAAAKAKPSANEPPNKRAQVAPAKPVAPAVE